jgi:hypothetical protein
MRMRMRMTMMMMMMMMQRTIVARLPQPQCQRTLKRREKRKTHFFCVKFRFFCVVLASIELRESRSFVSSLMRSFFSTHAE